MQRDMLILACHAADGHFADGDRSAVRLVLDQSHYISHLAPLNMEHFVVVCADGGEIELRAQGLESKRSFHRIELFITPDSWTSDIVTLLFDLMHQGGFGLVNALDSQYFIVTHPQQVSYFPWLPAAPLLVRSPRDLSYAL
ncbi:MAG: hypothetical protein JXA10_03935, partial [Anaerolineae bacterium]|nr:hypothetical protein [Anaerolineae bacterium]